MVAWCFVVVVVAEVVLAVVLEVDVDGFVGEALLCVTSRFQFARPAVDWSLLLQTILMPPVEAARAAIRPPVTFSSIS